jgi:hypothetical protein
LQCDVATAPLEAALSPAPDAIVRFGDEATPDDGKSIFVLDGASPERNGAIVADAAKLGDAALALALAEPLSFLLNGARRAAPAPPEAEPLAVWTYWEGERPSWIDTCLASIAAHAPNHRHFDRAGFDALREEDRDIDIDRLHVAHRADYIRAYLLAHFGGLWIDADCLVMRPLAPWLDRLASAGFLAHRDRQGYYPNEFVGAVRRNALARAFYDRVCAVLRSGAALNWISLGGAPLTQLLKTTTIPFLEIPLELVQPICWSAPEAYFTVADDSTHAKAPRRDALCHMLSNQEVKKLTARRPELDIEAPGSFFSYLARRSRAAVGGSGAAPKFPLEALAFFVDNLAAIAPRRILEVAERPGLWSGLFERLGPADCAVESLTSYASLGAELAPTQGAYDAILVIDAIDSLAPDAVRDFLREAAKRSKRLGVWKRQEVSLPAPIAGAKRRRRGGIMVLVRR